MDLSQFSTDDLKALQTGDLSKVSTAGLQLLHTQARAHEAAAAQTENSQLTKDMREGPSFLGSLGEQVGNLAAGAVRGAGSIGATILYPIDKATDLIKGDRGPTMSGMVTGQQPLSRNEQRRQDMDAALGALGADTQSPAYKVGKVGAEIAGTAGAGGALANIAGKVPAIAAAAPNLLAAVRSGGMVGGNMLARTAGGAINGGISAGLVDPSQAGAGAVVGGALPGAIKVAGAAGNAIGQGISSASSGLANRLMQSAIKPTIAQLRTGDADTAVQTLLDYGINPTKGGVNKLRDLIDAKNAEIANAINSSSATVSKQNALAALGDVRQKFGSQVSPTGDLNAIQGVENDFLAHPNFPGNDIPVQSAQALKQGTYSVLKGKYGQMGSAETEAQKAVARGLKDEIASAVPAVGPLNAEESRLLTTLSVAERRALMEMNKNPMGLAALAHNPLSWAAFMADKSALFKSLAARAVNSVAGAPNALQRLGSSNAEQLAYRAAPALVADQ
jgi:hypothetical protein